MPHPGFAIDNDYKMSCLLLLLLLIVAQTSKEYGAQKRVQLLLSITKEKQTYIIIQYLLYTRPYMHIDKLLNSY